jgi:hypothetical protein
MVVASCPDAPVPSSAAAGEPGPCTKLHLPIHNHDDRTVWIFTIEAGERINPVLESRSRIEKKSKNRHPRNQDLD